MPVLCAIWNPKASRTSTRIELRRTIPGLEEQGCLTEKPFDGRTPGKTGALSQMLAGCCARVDVSKPCSYARRKSAGNTHFPFPNKPLPVWASDLTTLVIPVAFRAYSSSRVRVITQPVTRSRGVRAILFDHSSRRASTRAATSGPLWCPTVVSDCGVRPVHCARLIDEMAPRRWRQGETTSCPAQGLSGS